MNKRVEKVVEFKLQNPNASVPESMAAVQAFTAAECADWAIQRRVQFAHKAKAATPSSVIAPTSNPLNLSPVTNPSLLSFASKNSLMQHWCFCSYHLHHLIVLQECLDQQKAEKE